MNKEFEDQLIEFTNESLLVDVKEGDHTSLSTIDEKAKGKAQIIAKEEGIIAGVQVGLKMFQLIDPALQVKTFVKDGERVKERQEVFQIEGSLHSILKAERLVLNVMQRMSGIATTTRSYVDLIKDTKARVLDTRKTTPLLRFLEKESVKIGGGVNHRFGLYDMILVKDNHIDFAGGITAALSKVYDYLKDKNLNIPVEVEVRDFQELNEVIDFGKVDRILLDNFTPEDTRKAVDKIGGSFILESSGGINKSTILAYAKTGVDYISVGGLTHSVKSLDLSLKAVVV